MAILTAKYTNAQASTEGLSTSPNPEFAMGVIGSNPSTRLQVVNDFITTTYPNAAFNITSTQVRVAFSPEITPDIFTGSFAPFSSTTVADTFSRISGTVTGWTSGAINSGNATNDRYSVTDINIDAKNFFNTATWVDILKGGDTLIGGAGNDMLQSYGTNNTFQGLGGYDAFIAADGGINLAIFRGNHSDYSIAVSNQISYDDLTGLAGFTVDDSVVERDGFTQMINIERLAFSDINVALDIGPSQNAGSVYMLYKAAFNRAPDEGGMGYWLAQKDGGANIVTNIAQGFVNSGEFTAKYGINPTNASYVDKLYLNVLGRAGEAGGVAYWNQQLDAGNISKAAVLVQFATLAEGASIVAPLIANGIPYQEWVG